MGAGLFTKGSIACVCPSTRATPPEKSTKIRPCSSRTSSCRKAYDRFFAGPSVDVRVVFGYKDARPARFVADRYERLLLLSRLLRRCRLGEYAYFDMDQAIARAMVLAERIIGQSSPRAIASLRR